MQEQLSMVTFLPHHCYDSDVNKSRVNKTADFRLTIEMDTGTGHGDGQVTGTGLNRHFKINT